MIVFIYGGFLQQKMKEAVYNLYILHKLYTAFICFGDKYVDKMAIVKLLMLQADGILPGRRQQRQLFQQAPVWHR